MKRQQIKTKSNKSNMKGKKSDEILKKTTKSEQNEVKRWRHMKASL